MKRQSKGAYQPPCLTAEGCPMGEDVAADPVVNDAASAWFHARQLYQLSEAESVYREVLDRVGLLDEPECLLELEKLWAQGLTKIRRKQSGQHSGSPAKSSGTRRRRMGR